MGTQENTQEDITSGFTQVDQTKDPRFFIEFLDARKTVEGEREVKGLIIQLLALKPGTEVLDVGCGTGDDAREMAAIVGGNGRVVGIDLSDTLITESKSRSTGSGVRIEFLIGDVRKLKFPDASFDRVRTDRVLMFVPEIKRAISEIVACCVREAVWSPLRSTMRCTTWTATFPKSTERCLRHSPKATLNHTLAGNCTGCSPNRDCAT